MRKLLIFLFGALIILSTIGIASAITIIDDTTLGYYNSSVGTVLDKTSFLFPGPNVSTGDPTINPAPEPDLNPASGALGNWLTDPNNLNVNWTGPQSIPLTWAINNETAIIYEFEVNTGYKNVVAYFGVDNGLFVWIDGSYVFGALAGGSAIKWEYTFNLGNLTAGTHFLQVLREDHGFVTGYHVQIIADEFVDVSPL